MFSLYMFIRFILFDIVRDIIWGDSELKLKRDVVIGRGRFVSGSLREYDFIISDVFEFINLMFPSYDDDIRKSSEFDLPKDNEDIISL